MQNVGFGFMHCLDEAGDLEDYERNGILRYLLDLKAQEPGILQLVEKYGWQYRTFSAEELETAEGEFTPSPFVKKITGIDNVCERSAVLAGGRLIKKKEAADGVTVALAAADWRAVF